MNTSKTALFLFLLSMPLLVQAQLINPNKETQQTQETKETVEENKTEVSSELTKSIRTDKLDERTFIMKRQNVKLDKVSSFYAENLPAAYKVAAEKGLVLVGMPCGLYFEVGEKEIDLGAGVSVESVEGEVPGFEVHVQPSTRALVLDFYGDYSKLGEGHEALEVYAEENGLQIQYPVMEEYLSDPSLESDPSNWLTRIYYPIAF